MPSDIAIGSNMGIPTGAPVKRNPIYLITLEKMVGKTQMIERFISLDKPQSENGFIQVKGIFCEKPEEEIIKSFNDILTSSPKELILEMLFPHHRIVSIRSLVFNAVKGATQIKSESK